MNTVLTQTPEASSIAAKPRSNLAKWLTPNTVLVGAFACAAAVTAVAALGSGSTGYVAPYPTTSIEYASHSMTGKEFMQKYCSEPESSDVCVSVAQSMKVGRELKADPAVPLAKSQRAAPAATNP